MSAVYDQDEERGAYEMAMDAEARKNCARGHHAEDIREEVDRFGHPVRIVYECQNCRRILEVVPGEFS